MDGEMVREGGAEMGDRCREGNGRQVQRGGTWVQRERERVPGKQRRWGEDKGNNRQRETSQSEKHLELMQRMDF